MAWMSVYLFVVVPSVLDEKDPCASLSCGWRTWHGMGTDACLAAPCADDPKEAIAENLFNRSEEFKARRSKQIQTPDFPTTTIGSFPQTPGAHSTSCLPLTLSCRPPSKRLLCHTPSASNDFQSDKHAEVMTRSLSGRLSA